MVSPACDADTLPATKQGQIQTQASSEKIDTVASWRGTSQWGVAVPGDG
jgi:hypothetical protein